MAARKAPQQTTARAAQQRLQARRRGARPRRPPARAGPRRAARRQHRGARHPRPPPRRHRRDLLAVPPVPGERSRHRHRLAPLGQLRHTSTCASANGRRRIPSGCGPTSRPPWPSSSHLAPITKRDRARGADAGRRRAAGARRRAHRPARAHAADGEPQGHLAHRRDAGRARGRRGGADEPAAAGAPVAASPAPCCSAISSIRPRAIAARINEMAEGGVDRPPRADPRPRRGDAWPTRAAWSSARPEGGERWVADRVETLRAGLPEESSPRIAPASRRRRAASAGRSWCITPTGPPPSRCSP